MDKQRFNSLMKGLRAAYPNFKLVDTKEGLEMWFQMLNHLKYEELSLAVQKHIATSKYPPSIADILDLANNLEEEKDWSVGWNLVIRAIQNFGQYRELEALEYINKHDELAYKVARNLNFKNICNSFDLNIDRANFRKAYENMAKLERQNNALPGRIKEETHYLKLKKMEELHQQKALDRQHIIDQEEKEEREYQKKLYGEIELSDDYQFIN